MGTVPCRTHFFLGSLAQGFLVFSRANDSQNLVRGALHERVRRELTGRAQGANAGRA